MTYKKKLIEVALPLEAINEQSAREKSIRHGHPATLHLWWARRPLAACRAVLFAQLVDDPSEHPDEFPSKADQQRERERLFRIIEELVNWDNVTNERVLDAARREILRSCGKTPPSILDPFGGGGSIPLEAQRLGLDARASDLNPIAVLINKALIEIPPRFAGRRPANPQAEPDLNDWTGARGLADDVRYYGAWMRDQAYERIGDLYPMVDVSRDDMPAGTPIAWLWTRAVTCPNPACGAEMPLASSFWLSKKKGRKTWVEPIIDNAAKTVTFRIATGAGEPPDPPKIGRGARFKCLVCDQIAEEDHIKAEGRAGRMTAKLLAIVVEGDRRRVYVPPDREQLTAAAAADPTWRPNERLAHDPRNIWCVKYGLETFDDLFTDRQLVALTTFSDLVAEARELIRKNAVEAGYLDDPTPLRDGGLGAIAYSEAVSVYLAMMVNRVAEKFSTLSTWDSNSTKEHIRGTFSRQALPMVWDYAEANIFHQSSGGWERTVDAIARVIERLPTQSQGYGRQLDARKASQTTSSFAILTDPPYYDNISYADLSDFFYIWARRSLRDLYPELFGTLLTPKTDELVASPYRHKGGKDEATKFFELGLGDAFAAARENHHDEFPMTVFYAFKQAESSVTGTASTGWETMLEGLLAAGWGISGIWPMRTERTGRTIAIGTNALASSVVLACRPMSPEGPLATRKEFVAALRERLPEALRLLQHGNIAPVDLAQAAIGPGMAVFTSYSRVIEADGSRMRVRSALELVNVVLDEVLSEQEGEFDLDTRWAVAWYEQHGMSPGDYGVGETLARAKNTAVAAVVDAGILESRAGKVRLLRRDELPTDWDPQHDQRTAVWEVTQHLIRRLEDSGEEGASWLLRQVGGLGDAAKDLAYRLFSICEQKGWAEEAFAYNSLVVAWPQLIRLASQPIGETPAQASLDV